MGKGEGPRPGCNSAPQSSWLLGLCPAGTSGPGGGGIPEGRPGHSLVALRAEARGLVILGAVDVGAVVERAVPAADGPAAPLVHEVPVEAGVGPVLCAFVLHEERALLRAEFLQVPAGTAPGVGRGGEWSLGLPGKKFATCPPRAPEQRLDLSLWVSPGAQG